MRHFFFIIPLFLLLLAIIYLFSPNLKTRVTPDAFIDQDALLLVSQQDLAERFDNFLVSPFGQALDAIDLTKIATDLELPPYRIAALERLVSLFSSAIKDPLVRSVVGRQVAIALVPFTYSDSLPITEQIMNNLVIVCRPKQPSHVMMLLKQVTGDSDVQEIPYGPYKILRYDIDNRHQFVSAQVKRLTVIAADERLLRRSLDNFDNRVNNLASNKDYLRLRKSFAGAAVYSYMNFENISPVLQRYFQQSNRLIFTWLEHQRKQLSFYRSGYFGAWIDHDSIHEKCYLNFAPEYLPEQYKTTFSTAPERPPNPRHVTDKTIWYYWTNSYSPRTAIEILASRFGFAAATDAKGGRKSLHGLTGLTIDQLVEALGNEVRFALKKAPRQELLPIPLGMVVVQCKKPKIVKKLAESLIKRYNVPVRKSVKEGYEITSWGAVIPLNSFEPSIAFIDNYLLIANNERQIREFIAMPEDARRLDESDLYQQVADGFSSKNNSHMYINTVELLALLKELISWTGMMVAIEDRETAGKAKIIIDRLISPILDGLTMYPAIGSRKYVNKDQVVMNATIIISEH